MVHYLIVEQGIFVCKVYHKYKLFFVFVMLFNDDHVLELRPDTVIVHRWMGNSLDDYDGQMVSRDKSGLNFLTFVSQLRENPGKNLNGETDPTRI